MVHEIPSVTDLLTGHIRRTPMMVMNPQGDVSLHGVRATRTEAPRVAAGIQQEYDERIDLEGIGGLRSRYGSNMQRTDLAERMVEHPRENDAIMLRIEAQRQELLSWRVEIWEGYQSIRQDLHNLGVTEDAIWDCMHPQ